MIVQETLKTRKINGKSEVVVLLRKMTVFPLVGDRECSGKLKLADWSEPHRQSDVYAEV